MIGRQVTSDTFIPFENERAHIARAHVVHQCPPIEVFKRHPIGISGFNAIRDEAV